MQLPAAHGSANELSAGRVCVRVLSAQSAGVQAPYGGRQPPWLCVPVRLVCTLLVYAYNRDPEYIVYGLGAMALLLVVYSFRPIKGTDRFSVACVWHLTVAPSGCCQPSACLVGVRASHRAVSRCCALLDCSPACSPCPPQP